LRLLLLI